MKCAPQACRCNKSQFARARLARSRVRLAQLALRLKERAPEARIRLKQSASEAALYLASDRTSLRVATYTRALLAFREGGGDDKQAVTLVTDAWSANEHVPGILAGAKPPVFGDSGYVTMGGPDEATYYFTEFGPAWHRTPGAVEWLAKITSTLPPKQRAYPAVH